MGRTGRKREGKVPALQALTSHSLLLTSGPSTQAPASSPSPQLTSGPSAAPPAPSPPPPAAPSAAASPATPRGPPRCEGTCGGCGPAARTNCSAAALWRGRGWPETAGPRPAGWEQWALWEGCALHLLQGIRHTGARHWPSQCGRAPHLGLLPLVVPPQCLGSLLAPLLGLRAPPDAPLPHLHALAPLQEQQAS